MCSKGGIDTRSRKISPSLDVAVVCALVASDQGDMDGMGDGSMSFPETWASCALNSMGFRQP